MPRFDVPLARYSCPCETVTIVATTGDVSPFFRDRRGGMVDNIRVNLTSVRAAADAADELAAQLSMPTASSVVSGGTGSGAGVNAVASALNEMRTNQGAQLTSRAGTLRIGSSSYEATDQDGAINVSRVEI
ncbi:hypothetical protein A5668_06525 [Mycolicibacterium fortuitum]|nr:hypothetical protein A5668_06525 [Mycolicibacterium fortuitum]